MPDSSIDNKPDNTVNPITGRWFGRERCHYHKTYRKIQLDISSEKKSLRGKGVIELMDGELMPVKVTGRYEEGTGEVTLSYEAKNGQKQGCKGWYKEEVILGVWGEYNPCHGEFKLYREYVWNNEDVGVFSDKEKEELIYCVLGISERIR